MSFFFIKIIYERETKKEKYIATIGFSFVLLLFRFRFDLFFFVEFCFVVKSIETHKKQRKESSDAGNHAAFRPYIVAVDTLSQNYLLGT